MGNDLAKRRFEALLLRISLVCHHSDERFFALSIAGPAIVRLEFVACGWLQLSTDLLDSISSPAVKEQLRASVDRALALGVFGVPSFVIGSELFWGHDRMPHIEAFLRGELVLDEELHARMLARPRGIDRQKRSASAG